MSKKVIKGKKELKQLLDSSKFNATITIINVVLIIGVVIWLIVSISGDAKKSEINVEGENAGVVSDVDVDKLVSEADASMPGIYKALLAGSDFDCGNGMEFHFGFNGEFSGFFDANEKSVTGYTYEVLSENGKDFTLKIVSSDGKKYVEYGLKLNSDGNILLTYPGSDTSILLSY